MTNISLAHASRTTLLAFSLLLTIVVAIGCGGPTQSALPLAPTVIGPGGSLSSTAPATSDSAISSGRPAAADPARPAPRPDPERDFREVAGVVGSVDGDCPEVVFTIDDMRFATGARTDYRNGRCSDLQPRVHVQVKFAPARDGAHHAVHVTFRERSRRRERP